jgi:hypothetical protein
MGLEIFLACAISVNQSMVTLSDRGDPGRGDYAEERWNGVFPRAMRCAALRRAMAMCFSLSNT